MEENQLKIELEAVINSSTFNRSMLTALLNSVAKEQATDGTVKKPKPTGGPCTVYKTIKRIYTCTHCGHMFSSTVELKQGESVPCMSPTGRVVIITSESPAEINVATSSCDHCPQYIHFMEREELERRYMELLRESRFKINFAQKLNIEEVTIRI